MLQHLLTDGWLRGSDQRRITSALLHPWCWPLDDDLAARARALGFPPPPSPGPGETLLVSVTPAVRSALWVMRRVTGPIRPPCLPFKGEARELLGQCIGRVSKDLPLLESADLGPGEWCGELAWKEGDGLDCVLDGGSYGLSSLLAAGSSLMNLPVPHDLAASAAVVDNGDLSAVEGLEAKLILLEGSALGVSRVLVAKEQEQQAHAALSAGSRLTIVGVRTVADAMAVVFPGIGRRPPEAWTIPEGAREAATRLFHLALDGGVHIVDWNCVVRSARHVAECKGLDEASIWKASFAEEVARRHENDNREIPWPDKEKWKALPHPDKLAYLSHVIQSHTDACSERLPSTLKRARGMISLPLDGDVAKLPVAGAVGRALSSRRDYSEAARWLEQAVGLWFDTRNVAQASRALCELLRVTGVQGDAERLAQLRERVIVFEHLAHDDHISRAFVRTALGRALVLVEDAACAVDWISDGVFDWTAPIPPHVLECRLRWYAAALDRSGARDASDGVRERLEAAGPGCDNVLLARLDRALEGDDESEIKGLLAAMEQVEPRWVGRLVDPAATVRARAEGLAREYPY